MTSLHLLLPSPFPRVLLALALVTVLGILTAPAAAAHGASFGPRPPDRAPKDPTPPPPPPTDRPPLKRPPRGDAPPERATPPPSVPSPRPGGALPPPVTTPVVRPRAPTTAPQRTPPKSQPSLGQPIGRRMRDRGLRGRSGLTNLEDSWETWWALNRRALLPDRREGDRRQVVTPREGDDADASWAMERTDIARHTVLPFLLRLLDPKRPVRDDVRASALIALGKVARDRVAVQLLFRWLEDGRAANIVRESAALGVGLLRRTRRDMQADGATLDQIRGRLLAVFDDARAPSRTRSFAALSVGLLGDQPYGDAWTKDGRLIIRDLWRRLRSPNLGRDLRISLIVGLGRQPSAGVPDAMRAGLRHIALGKRTLRRRWSALEQGHALSALVRLGGPGVPAFIGRVLEHKRTARELRRAAFTALADRASRWSATDRAHITRALLRGIRHARDPLTEGLGHIAAGHVLGADLASGSGKILTEGQIPQLLLAEAKGGATTTRGFSAIALGIAARDVQVESRPALVFETEAASVLHEGLVRGRGDDTLLGAYAVGLGLIGAEPSREVLREVVADDGRQPRLRGYAAVALGQIGGVGSDGRRVLNLALADHRFEVLRREAALALALLGGRVVGTQLLRELQGTGRTERMLGQVVEALGQLGDPRAVAALVEHASDAGRSELAQALGVVALGRIADPETRPSLLRLTRNANYPSRTEALHEVYTIL